MNNQVLTSVEHELSEFDRQLDSLNNSFEIEKIAKRAIIIKPKNQASESSSRDIHLSIFGCIHGVEVAGLSVLNGILKGIMDKSIQLECNLGIAVGNFEAVLQKKRYVERDLNRSFGRLEKDTLEDRRADELEALLNRTRYLLDFHQVTLKTAHPFWIFPYHKEGYSFARSIGGKIPLVTHWEGSFSKEGQCSDEYLIRTGACGVTLELGQNGFEKAQIDLGIEIALNAINEVRVRVAGETRGPRLEHALGPIYTWAEVIPYPQTAETVLDAGWSNFAIVAAGERLGEYQGKPVSARKDGWMLFPKYPDPSRDHGKAPPSAELVRILRKIDESDLPD